MPSKKKTGSKSGKKATVSKKDVASLGPVAYVVKHAAASANVSQVAAKEVLVAAFAAITAQVKAGNFVAIRGFGTFKKRTIKGRTIKTPAGKRVTFKTFSKVGLSSKNHL